MTSSIKLSYCGPEQKTPSDEGDWKIFIMMKLTKFRLWPKDLSFACDDEKKAFLIRSKEFYYMNARDIVSLSELLTANGFERIGNWFEPAYQPKTNIVPERVKEPNEPEFDYDSDGDAAKA
jgi:hypothetical protein